MVNKIEFLQKVAPFNLLPETVIKEVSDLMVFKQFQPDEKIYIQDETSLDTVDIIVKGAYKAYFFDSNGAARLEELYDVNDIYGGSSVLLNKQYSIRTVYAQGETEILTLDKEEFKSLCRSFENFFQHFTIQFGNKMLNDEYAHFVKRNNKREENFMDADIIFTRKINSITPQGLVTCSAQTTIKDAANLMIEKKVNCIYVKEDDKLTAWISKDTLVRESLAKGVSSDTAVIEIAQKDIISIQKDALVYEALFALYPLKQEYILVKDGEINLGYLSRYRLLTENAQSPLVFIQSVKLSNTVVDLKEKWSKVPEIISTMIGRGVHAEIISRIVTTIADEILLRVIKTVESEMGEAPAKYCFMVIGSEGRQEQTLATDQDNAIIYEDKANEQRELVRTYFLEFADKISTKLNDIGFKFCTGGFMAKNPKWCHSLSHWKTNYDMWINKAAPDTVIKLSTFFDCRYIYGEKELFEDLHTHMLKCLDHSNSKFLMNLVKNALQYEPPIGLFSGIRTFTKGGRKVFNIKKSMATIVDMVRMYSLKYKIVEMNTGRRMRKLYEAGHFDEKKYKELMHAYYYLMGVRFKSQSMEILDDFKEATNYIEPKKLTQVEQVALKEIFKFIKDLQWGLKGSF